MYFCVIIALGGEIMSKKISVLAANHTCYKKIMPDAIFLHEHDVYELMFFIKVNGVFFMEGKAYRLKKNDILLIPPCIQHRIIMDAPSEYERYNVLLDPNVLPDELRDMLPNINSIIHVDEQYIDALFSDFDMLFQSFDSDTAFVGIDAIVKVLLFRMYLLSKDGDLKQTSRVNPIVTRATAYIQKNLSTLTGVEEICEELFVTKSHLHHIFKKYLMTTPKKYITSKRLFEAQRLIRTGTHPIDAYTACGFTDYATFYRNYKSFFGRSPSKEKDSEIVREQYF